VNVRIKRRQPKRTAKGERTKAAIAAAACGLFAGRGYAAVSIPDIADAVGIAPATLYRHFESKEDLVNHVFAEAKGAMMDALADAKDPGAPPRQQFSNVWRGLARFAAESPDEFAFLELHHHAPYLSPENQQLEAQSLAVFIDLLVAGTAAGIIRPMPPAAAIAMTWGAWSGLVKAVRLGALQLTDELIAATEEAAWAAIARG
jgi:AcrR family transcriptional regulator